MITQHDLSREETEGPTTDSYGFHRLRLAARSASVAMWADAQRQIDLEASSSEEEIQVLQANDHKGEPAEQVDATTLAAGEVVLRDLLPNVKIHSEERTLGTTVARGNDVLAVVDPTDGSWQWRFMSENFASVTVIFVYRVSRPQWTFKAASIAYSHGRVHSMNDHGWVSWGHCLGSPEQDRPGGLSDRSGQAFAMSGSRSSNGQVDNFRVVSEALVEEMGMRFAANVAGNPAGFDVCHRELDFVVEPKASTVYDAAYTLFVAAVGGTVVDLSTMEELRFTDLKAIVSADPFGAAVVPPHIAGKSRERVRHAAEVVRGLAVG